MRQMFLMLLLLISSALAEKVDRTGPYLSLGTGYARFYDDKRFVDVSMDPSYDINLIGGAYINKYLSVELSVDYFDKFTNTENENSTSIYIIDATTKVHYGFWRERIDLYAAFGAGGIFWKEYKDNVSRSDNSGVIRGDAGVGFRVMKDLTINVGYRRYFFTLEHDTGSRDEVNNIIYDTYNMQIGSAYTNIEVQF